MRDDTNGGCVTYTERITSVVTLYIYIWKVFDLNLGRVSTFLNEVLMIFLSLLAISISSSHTKVCVTPNLHFSYFL